MHGRRHHMAAAVERTVLRPFTRSTSRSCGACSRIFSSSHTQGFGLQTVSASDDAAWHGLRRPSSAGRIGNGPELIHDGPGSGSMGGPGGPGRKGRMDAHWHHGDGNNGSSDSSTALLTIASTIAVALMASAVMLIYAIQAWVAALGAMVTMMYTPFMLITEAIMSVLWFPFATTSAITSMAAPVGTALFGAPFLLLEQAVAAGISPLMRALHLAPCPADAASMQHMQQQQQEQEHQQRTAQVARTLAAGLYGMLLAVVAQEVWRWWKKRGGGGPGS
ncbi:hypothetical protein V8C86DRAFT_2551096 [Haematococcus lacustris]